MNIKRVIAFPFMLIITLILAVLYVFAGLFIGAMIGVPYTIVKFWQGGSVKEEIITFFKVPFEIIADLWRINE